MNSVAAVLLSTLAVSPPAGTVFPDPSGRYVSLRVVGVYTPPSGAGWLFPTPLVRCEPMEYPDVEICLRRPATVWGSVLLPRKDRSR